MRLTASDLADYRELVDSLFPGARCVSCRHARIWHHAEQWAVPVEGWQVVFRCSGCLSHRYDGARCPGPFLPVRPEAAFQMGVPFLPGVVLRDPPGRGSPMRETATSNAGGSAGRSLDPPGTNPPA